MPPKSSYTRAEMFKIVGMVVGGILTTYGGGSYLLQEPVEQTDQAPGPKKKVAESDEPKESDLVAIKKSLESLTITLGVVKDSVLSLGIEQKHMKESIKRVEDANKETSDKVERLRRSSKPLYSCEELFDRNLAAVRDTN